MTFFVSLPKESLDSTSQPGYLKIGRRFASGIVAAPVKRRKKAVVVRNMIGMRGGMSKTSPSSRVIVWHCHLLCLPDQSDHRARYYTNTMVSAKLG